jgi:hypothetical protein
MLDLLAELADRRVSEGADDGRRHTNWHLPCVRAAHRPHMAGLPAPERPPPGPSASPAGSPEALLGLWTELAWRHCHAVVGAGERP